MSDCSVMFFEKAQKIFFLFLVALSISSVAVAQTAIEVFADEPVNVPSISNAVIRVFDLSRVETVRESAPHFSGDPVKAEMEAIVWLGSPAGKQHMDSLQAAYAGHINMMSYGLQKIPAIVFDKGKFVIYGTTDVVLATKDYQDFMRTYKPAKSSTDNTTTKPKTEAHHE